MTVKQLIVGQPVAISNTGELVRKRGGVFVQADIQIDEDASEEKMEVFLYAVMSDAMAAVKKVRDMSPAAIAGIYLKITEAEKEARIRTS